ncbi:MAG: phospho-sugar mutase [Myxococcota bacterium]
MESILEMARKWAAADPDPKTRAEAEALIAEGDEKTLQAHFGQRLQFGTAGIRGAMAAGPGYINRALVRQVTAGLGRYLLQAVPSAAEKGVVIGFDGRHNSDIFAADAARVLAGMGITIRRFSAVVPTPVLAHAVTFCEAAAGIMITASHNPPADNGYKVYWTNGAQIIPPHDRGISDQIDAIGGPWGVDAPELDTIRDKIVDVPDAAWDDYQRRVLSWRALPHHGARGVYSAMHGVGWASLNRILEATEHETLIAVPEQRDPNGDFPTVDFPNPEEPGALDLSMALATKEGADIILANDPDADRLAVALPAPRGGWRKLTGNEIGLLLADAMLQHGPQKGDRMVATTVVSTSMLGRLAEAHGADLTETLTGFKWIANAAIAYKGTFLVGFEEALGYSVGDVVRDKDGVSAALHLLDLASWCKVRGTTLLQHLESIYQKYGYAASAQKSIKMPGAEGAARINAILKTLRENPPRQIGGLNVWRVRDALTGIARVTATGETSTLGLPTSNVLAFDLEENCRVLARPSGTEPKVKFYFEVSMPFQEGDTLANVEARAQEKIATLQADLLKQAGI